MADESTTNRLDRMTRFFDLDDGDIDYERVEVHNDDDVKVEVKHDYAEIMAIFAAAAAQQVSARRQTIPTQTSQHAMPTAPTPPLIHGLHLPEELKVGAGDSLRPYLLLFNSHDASSPLRAVLTTVRVVCQNTLNLAMGIAGNEGVTIRHRGALQAQVDQARTTLGLAHRRLKPTS